MSAPLTAGSQPADGDRAVDAIGERNANLGALGNADQRPGHRRRFPVLGEREHRHFRIVIAFGLPGTLDDVQRNR